MTRCEVGYREVMMDGTETLVQVAWTILFLKKAPFDASSVKKEAVSRP